MSSNPADPVFDLVNALNALTKNLGIVVHVEAQVKESDPEDSKQRKSLDFAWLINWLRNGSNFESVRGNYVVPHCRHIIVAAPSKKVVERELRNQDHDPSEMLIIPICVPGADSELDMENVMAQVDE